MAKAQPWKDEGMKKAQWVAKEVAKAVNAGKQWDLETVDFSDPNRPLTCLEVDFPIIPINQIAAIEGNAGKPIYQMSKWWARRRSSVFRSLLLAAAIKAPDDPSEAAKLVWNVYYGNHQAKGAFKNLKVADIFMGGGTTVVEGSRLGMQMYGNDLNPIAWFVVKNELAQVDKAEVEALLADIEAEVKPQIMPFYTCDCPRGHKGKWTNVTTGVEMPEDFDPLTLTPEQRKGYTYEGPEVIYTFWAKHGPCSVTGCGHRTPIMRSPVMAVKTISIKVWKRKCSHCGDHYDLEEKDARMAPSVPLVVAATERPFAVAQFDQWGKIKSATCPLCGKMDVIGCMPRSMPKPSKKTVELSLLVHPDWLKGEPATDAHGRPYGGSADDDIDATVRWNQVRAKTCKLVEVRGKLPDEITCPNTGVVIKTGKEGGTTQGRGGFTCQASTCGRNQDLQAAVKASGGPAPFAPYALQGFCPRCKEESAAYGGRFFLPFSDPRPFNRAAEEWTTRRQSDLRPFWPVVEIQPGAEIGPHDVYGHHYRYWHYLFNERQLTVHALLLRAIMNAGSVADDVREYVLGAFQQYLRNQVMFCFWNTQADKMEPFYSDGHFHPKASVIENSVFSDLGRGNWASCSSSLSAVCEWKESPWELVSNQRLSESGSPASEYTSGGSEKVYPQDPVLDHPEVRIASATELAHIDDHSLDLVVTDPPFAGLEQYAELADFFHIWLRLPLKDHCAAFEPEQTPKALEAVSNKARHPNDPDAFYRRILSDCWREANRILKPGGMLAFTFHHSEDAPWVDVLESLFNAGFYLTVVYPIRGDETKGEGAGSFGSQKVEYDMVHVCRKRQTESVAISWAKLRRQILHDVRDLQDLLEHHSEEGLPEADLQVIRRGKALEYFSRHYGKVFKDQDTPMTVLEALLGINQLLDEEAGGIKETPPHNAEPFTRMLLRLFDGKAELPRDQMQKFLRGSGSAPSDFVSRGWVEEKKKVFYLISPLEMAQGWIGKQRRTMTSDYDQAMFFVGACFECSGINASETLNNANFKPHPALGALLTWFKTHGADSKTRNAAVMAAQLYRNWEAKNQPKVEALLPFMLDEEEA